MITAGGGEVIITNDGATILNKMEVQHPAARMLVDVSKAQDVEAGDGTTTVVVLAGGLLSSAQELLDKGSLTIPDRSLLTVSVAGLHPSQISDAVLETAKRVRCSTHCTQNQ